MVEKPFGFDSDTHDFLRLGTKVVSEPSAASALQQRAVGLALYEHGHHAGAEISLRNAYRSACRESNEELASELALDIARSVLHRSPREAIGLVRSLEIPGEAAPAARLYNLLGRILVEMCQYRLADRNYRQAIETAQRERDEPSVAYALANRAGNLFDLGYPVEAEGLYRQSLERLDELDDPGSIGLVLCNLGTHSMLLGRIDEACEWFDRSRESQQASNNLRLAALLDLNRGELALATGEHEEALEHLTVAERTAALAALPSIQVRSLIWKWILKGGDDGASLLSDLEAAAQDLHARDLRSDSAMIYLIAACHAERTGESGERYKSVATSIFGREEEPRLLGDHYARILGLLQHRSHAGSWQPFPQFLTQAPELLRVKKRLQRLVDTDVRILIEGESGTGKTFLARQIHDAGRSRGAPLIVVDCTNLDEALFESKLFGHVRGAFTGAVSDSIGLVEQANGGTLFLDEIGELPTEIQARLLLTIEEKRYRPVGSRVEKTAEFRVVAATNRDIDAMLDDGRLRNDLYYRIAGYRVHLPPLRLRREDIVPLVEHRLGRLNARYGRRKVLRPRVWEAMARHDWPGNVRELNTALERGYHLAPGRRIDLDDLGLEISPNSKGPEDLSWYAVRRDHLLRVLRLCRGNVTRAARLLGLNRTTLIYKLKLLDITRPDFDPGYAPGKRPGEEPVRIVADRE